MPICRRQQKVCFSSQSQYHILTLSRGIPTGYLGTLEQRLTETENALSSVLRVLQDSGISTTLLDELLAQSESTTASGPETNINKTARMIEWKRYPLQSNKELLEWRRFFSNSLPTTPRK